MDRRQPKDIAISALEGYAADGCSALDDIRLSGPYEPQGAWRPNFRLVLGAAPSGPKIALPATARDPAAALRDFDGDRPQFAVR